MANRKYGYQDFRYDDLTGGINVKDYPSEIEDKQSLHLKNWNFDGNKLVSEKGFSDTGLPERSDIGAITIDSGDIWVVSSGVAYKNGQGIEGSSAVVIGFKTDKFNELIKYKISIRGNVYQIYGKTPEDCFNMLKDKASLDGLSSIIQPNLIMIYDEESPILESDISTDFGKTTILYNNNNTLDVEDMPYGIYKYGLHIGEDKIYGTVDMGEQIELKFREKVIMEKIYNDIDSLGYNIEPIYIKGAGSDYDLDSIVTEEEGYTYLGIVIYGEEKVIPQSSIFYKYQTHNTYTGGNYVYVNSSLDACTFGGKRIGPPDMYSATLPTEYDSIEYTDSMGTSGFTDLTSLVDYIKSIGRFAEVSADKLYVLHNLNEGYGDGVYGDMPEIKYTYLGIEYILDVSKTLSPYTYNNSGITWREYNNFYGFYPYTFVRSRIEYLGYNIESALKNNSYYYVVFHREDYEKVPFTGYVIETFDESRGISLRKIEENSNGFDISFFGEYNSGLGRCNLTVGNLGSLLVDNDNGGASYLYEGLSLSIGESSIGKPTVGTIYNGKAVLGGYKGNDNIIFSKTGSPTSPLNVLNFIDYSAGGQSVSGGDKGEITGMMVGENGLYVFKDNSVWYTNSEKDDPNSLSFNFIFNKITSNGALNQNVITEVGQEIFYLDWKNRGVRRLGYEQNLTTLRDTAISKEIKPLLDALPEDQPLATSHFKYPYYTVSLSDHTSGTITYSNGNTYYLNNKHFIYNVENKSWTTRGGVSDMIVSHKGYFVRNDGKVYEDFVGNTTEAGEHESKELTFFDDVDYKRYKEFEVVGDIKGIGGVKNFELQILVDEEELDIGEPSEPYKRIISAEDGQTVRFREKVDLFDDGQRFKYKLLHNGNGYVEISDVNIRVKGLDVFRSEYY